MIISLNLNAAYDDAGTEYSTKIGLQKVIFGVAGNDISSDQSNAQMILDFLNQLHYGTMLNKGDYNGTILIDGQSTNFTANSSRVSNTDPLIVKLWVSDLAFALKATLISSSEPDFPLGSSTIEYMIGSEASRVVIQKGTTIGEQLIDWISKQNRDGTEKLSLGHVNLNTVDLIGYGRQQDINLTASPETILKDNSFGFNPLYAKITDSSSTSNYFDLNLSAVTNSTNSIGVFDTTTGTRFNDFADTSFPISMAENNCTIFDYAGNIQSSCSAPNTGDFVTINTTSYVVRVLERQAEITTSIAEPSTNLITIPTDIILPNRTDLSETVNTDIGNEPTPLTANINIVVNGKYAN